MYKLLFFGKTTKTFLKQTIAKIFHEAVKE
jgi:hypothetical protein